MILYPCCRFGDSLWSYNVVEEAHIGWALLHSLGIWLIDICVSRWRGVAIIAPRAVIHSRPQTYLGEAVGRQCYCSNVSTNRPPTIICWYTVIHLLACIVFSLAGLTLGASTSSKIHGSCIRSNTSSHLLGCINENLSSYYSASCYFSSCFWVIKPRCRYADSAMISPRISILIWLWNVALSKNPLLARLRQRGISGRWPSYPVIYHGNWVSYVDISLDQGLRRCLDSLERTTPAAISVTSLI